MDLDRDIRSIANKIHNPSASKSNVAPQSTSSNQGLASLIVMIAVLTIIILFCCFAAPGIRGLCKRYIFRSCPYDDPETDNASSTPAAESATPTVILLPHGRMLVVDRNVLTQLHVDSTGIDFLELSANLIRAQRQQPGSTPSILGSDTTSKGISPTSLGFSPPAYEDIFGDKHLDLPPSYSEVSLVLNHHNEQMSYLRKHVQASMTFGNISNSDVDNIELANLNNNNNNNCDNNGTSRLRSQGRSLIIRNPLDNHASLVLLNHPNGTNDCAILTNNNEQYHNRTAYYDEEGNIEMLTDLDNSEEVTNESIQMERIDLCDSVSNRCDNDNVSLSDIDTEDTSKYNETVRVNVDELEGSLPEDMV